MSLAIQDIHWWRILLVANLYFATEGIGDKTFFATNTFSGKFYFAINALFF